MTMFRFAAGEDFFEHIVFHETRSQPEGKLPRTLHIARCGKCDEEIELHGTLDEIEQAFKNALFTHHIQVLAERLKNYERRESRSSWHSGGELLGGD